MKHHHFDIYTGGKFFGISFVATEIKVKLTLGNKVKVLYSCKELCCTLGLLNTSEILLVAEMKSIMTFVYKSAPLSKIWIDFLTQWGQQNFTEWKYFRQTFNLKH